MSRPQASKIAGPRRDLASRAELCKTFEREMKPLYLLAFLLMGNHNGAEQCFAATLEEILQGHGVFRDWAMCWIRRTLIRNAIDMVLPGQRAIAETGEPWTAGSQETVAGYRIDAVTQLMALERFVFVLSILERYSGRECSILLGCSTAKVIEARMRALRGLVAPVAPSYGSEAQDSEFVEIPA
jgi:DNA-directed RNA polymerase specialized sigma24 family protein